MRNLGSAGRFAARARFAAAVLAAALLDGTAGSDAQAVSYIEAETADGRVLWGVGMDSNIVTASLKAVTCAANRAVSK